MISNNIKRKSSAVTNIEDLMLLDGENFINCAYSTFLKREPDSEGYSYYLERIRNGVTKEELIVQFANSREAREKNIDIIGLNNIYRRQRFNKISLFSKLIFSKSRNSDRNLNVTKSNIACIIPYYNGSAFIERALISVFHQTIPANEVIVVDDGSREDEHTFLVNLNKQFKFKLLRKTNGGQGSARNAGVAASKSEYICFLDQDDFYLPQHNDILLKGIPPNDPNFGWIYADLREADGDGLIVRMSMVKEHSVHPKNALFDLLRNDMFILPSASLINRRAYEDVGGFDEQFTGYEDDDLFLRLFRCGWSNTFVDKPVTTWCIHGESTSYSVKMSRSRFKYLEKLLKNHPDDPQKKRFIFRDLIFPRFEGLIVSDARVARETNSKDRDELMGYLIKFYEITRNSQGMHPSLISGLEKHINDINSL